MLIVGFCILIPFTNVDLGLKPSFLAWVIMAGTMQERQRQFEPRGDVNVISPLQK